jgi:hypothetical protein
MGFGFLPCGGFAGEPSGIMRWIQWVLRNCSQNFLFERHEYKEPSGTGD